MKNKNIASSKWLIIFIFVVQLVLLLVAIAVYYVDPYFHYHKPNINLNYTISNQRYQNNGILVNFDYDALIIGTSLSEFFKTSEMDEIFDCNSIKTPFSAASYRELADNIDTALDTHEIKYIVRPLDFNNRLVADKDSVAYSGMPTYLYDDDYLNDVEYLLNKSVFVNDCLPIIKDYIVGNPGGITSFDDYGNWEYAHIWGKEGIIADKGYTPAYATNSISNTPKQLSEADRMMLRDNVMQNVIQQAAEHPEVQFYYFFPPQSIARWGEYYEAGEIEYRLEAEQYAIELMLPIENIHLFSFSDRFDWCTDLNNYCDVTHYASWIDTEILKIMHSDIGRLSYDNYLEHMKRERLFYTEYDYSSIFGAE